MWAIAGNQGKCLYKSSNIISWEIIQIIYGIIKDMVQLICNSSLAQQISLWLVNMQWLNAIMKKYIYPQTEGVSSLST